MGTVMLHNIKPESLMVIQTYLLEFFGLPDRAVDWDFAYRPDRLRVARRRQRANKTRLVDGKCAVCGTTEELQRHHIISPLLGGTNARENLVYLCRVCHTAYHKEEL